MEKSNKNFLKINLEFRQKRDNPVRDCPFKHATADARWERMFLLLFVQYPVYSAEYVICPIGSRIQQRADFHI